MASPRVRRARKLAIIEAREKLLQKEDNLPNLDNLKSEEEILEEREEPKGYKKIKQKDVHTSTLQKRIDKRKRGK